MNHLPARSPLLLLLGLLLLCLFAFTGATRTTSAASQAYSRQQPTTTLLINEVDVDQTGSDTAEFIELYDGGVGNTSLTGLVLVWYNGGDDKSYRAFDLDNYTTNGKGYFVLGNSAVASAVITFTNGALQNGPDALALYTANATDFPNGAAITTTNLLDALVYDVDHADDAGLLTLLHVGQPQVNEAGSGDATAASLQRCPNGDGGQRNTNTYLAMPPSPNSANACGGATSTPTATPTVVATPTPTITPTSTPLNGVGVTAPIGAAGVVGSQILLPLRLSNSATGTPLLGYEFQLDYNPTVLQSLGVSTTNTVSADWQITVNQETPGQLRVVGYGVNPLSGDGILLNLHFGVTQTVNMTSALTFDYFRWNEGHPAATTQSGDFRTRLLRIGGNVLYGVNGEPVPQTTLTLTGAQTANATTNAQGAYHFDLAASGAISINLSKSGDSGLALSALDAAWILQCTVNLRPSGACPPAAGDSSGDGQVTAYDAALLARHLVGFTPPASQAGQWRFTPPSRTYPTLSADLSQEDYTAYLVGDVTGNWGSNGATSRAATQLAAITPYLTAIEDEIHLLLPVATTNVDLLAYQLTVQYNPATIQFVTVEKANSLSAGWFVLENGTQAGLVQIIAYGATPLHGGGSLLTLRFQPTATFNPAMDLRLGGLSFNENQPAMIRQEALPGIKTFLPLAVR